MAELCAEHYADVICRLDGNPLYKIHHHNIVPYTLWYRLNLSISVILSHSLFLALFQSHAVPHPNHITVKRYHSTHCIVLYSTFVTLIAKKQTHIDYFDGHYSSSKIEMNHFLVCSSYIKCECVYVYIFIRLRFKCCCRAVHFILICINYVSSSSYLIKWLHISLLHHTFGWFFWRER